MTKMDFHTVSYRHKAGRIVSEPISTTLNIDDVLEMIKHYESRCKEFIDIFDDDGYFKTLANRIVFGHNPKRGGAISIRFDNLEDLFLPTEI
jgi:hypothetical protein